MRRWMGGIMSFAVDPGVVTAAYVQQEMGLPGCPYESVKILQNKDLFRAFLRENGFNCPWSYGFGSVEEALAAANCYTYPAIVKPTDSAGSKGVTRIDSSTELPAALENAIKNSISGRIIVEQFLEKQGCSSDTDSFSVNGKLAFVSFSAQRFNANAPNPYTPSAFSWPSTMTREEEDYLTAELQRLITLLGLTSSIYNIETRVCTDGKPYIMEMSPRGGGNRLAEMLRYATGVDLISNAVRAAVGLPTENIEQKPYQGHWAEVILHAPGEGIFHGLEIAPAYRQNVIETDLWVRKGDRVFPFRGANDAIGTLVFKFDSEEDLSLALQSDLYCCNIGK